MKKSPLVLCLRRFAWLALALLPSLGLSLRADPAATGSIVGRIQNEDTGEYLYGARVSVMVGATPGAGLIASTDQSGSYRLEGVPAGSVTLQVVYSGMPTSTSQVTVEAGREAVADVELRAHSEIVKLDAFQVNVAKEMSSTELAINTQRYAANLKSVIAVSDLGFIGDGSIANALKFIPGVDLEQDGYGYGNAVTLSGAPSANVPITFGGFQMTTTADSTQGVSAPRAWAASARRSAPPS